MSTIHADHRAELEALGFDPLEARRSQAATRRAAEKAADDLIERLGDRLAFMSDAEIEQAIADAVDAAL